MIKRFSKNVEGLYNEAEGDVKHKRTFLNHKEWKLNLIKIYFLKVNQNLQIFYHTGFEIRESNVKL